jgi:hypothetical protein
MIFEIEDKLVTSEIFENNFVCDLNACKGECCVVGDAGAPLEKEEILEIENILPIVKKYGKGKKVHPGRHTAVKRNWRRIKTKA